MMLAEMMELQGHKPGSSKDEPVGTIAEDSEDSDDDDSDGDGWEEIPNDGATAVHC